MTAPTVSACDIAHLVAMPELLRALSFDANERTHRALCLLHSGSNPTAFSWREDGRWHCFSCGAGGDRIALVRAVKQCSFREAVHFLAALAGVEYQTERVSREEIERARHHRKRLERAAWAVRDEQIRLLCYYRDGLHRSERLMAKLGETHGPDCWGSVARLAWPQTFFLAAYTFMCRASREAVAHFVVASPAARRKMILEEGSIR